MKPDEATEELATAATRVAAAAAAPKQAAAAKAAAVLASCCFCWSKVVDWHTTVGEVVVGDISTVGEEEWFEGVLVAVAVGT